jgi:FtsH-binding integral membrane protein
MRIMSERRPGLREVLLVGGIVVGVVAIAVVVTAVLPAGGQYIVLRTPLLIVVLIAGTAGVLWRITRPGRPER